MGEICSNIHTNCQSKCYHGDIKYHTTLYVTFNVILCGHNIIQIHNNGLFMEYSHVQSEYEKYSMEYC